MNCNELRDFYELHALGVAEEPARGEIRAHLDRGCETCTQGMQRAKVLLARLSGGAPPRRFGWAPFLAVALGLAVFAAIYFGGREYDLGKELVRLRGENGQQNIQLTRINEAFLVLNGTDTGVTSFGESRDAAKGRIFSSPSQGVLLIANHLPPAPSGKAYEMWVIAKGASPKPAGMFQSTPDGSAMHLERGPLAASAESVTVTVEDRAGVPMPTSAPLITVRIGALKP